MYVVYFGFRSIYTGRNSCLHTRACGYWRRALFYADNGIFVVNTPSYSMPDLLIPCYLTASTFMLISGSGNVLKIQKLLHILSEKYEEKTDKIDKAKSTSAGAEKSKSKDHHHHKKDSRRATGNASSRRTRRHANSTGTKPSTESTQATTEEPMQVDEQVTSGNDDVNVSSTPNQVFDYHAHQGLAVLGVAIIAMGEEVGLEMAFRMFGHLVRFLMTLIRYCPFLSDSHNATKLFVLYCIAFWLRIYYPGNFFGWKHYTLSFIQIIINI